MLNLRILLVMIWSDGELKIKLVNLFYLVLGKQPSNLCKSH